MGICYCFLSGEGFGSNYKKGGFWIVLFQGFCYVGVIYVGYKVYFYIGFLVGFQCFCDYYGIKVRVFNIDIDDCVQWFVGKILLFFIYYLIGESFYVAQYFIDFRYYIFFVYFNGQIGVVVQGDVQYGVFFCFIDWFIGEYLFNGVLQFVFFGQLQQ